MLQRSLLLLGLIALIWSCKKDELVPLKPTLLTMQVIYQLNQQPVDSAHVVVSGTKGSYLTGREIQTFLDAYTDRQGRIQATMIIPRDYAVVFDCGKNVKIGGSWKLYSMANVQPYSDKLKREQDNSIVVQLDTLK